MAPKSARQLNYPYLVGSALAEVLEEECVFALRPAFASGGALFAFDPASLGQLDENFEGWAILEKGKAQALSRFARLIVSHPEGELRRILVACWRQLHGQTITDDQPFRQLARLVAREHPAGYTGSGCEGDFSECLTQENLTSKDSKETPPW